MITKQGKTLRDLEKLKPLVELNGFRRLGDLPPIIHVKMALLGCLGRPEDGSPFASGVSAFERVRLWVSSENFTASSRRNLEFGYWTEDTALLQVPSASCVKLVKMVHVTCTVTSIPISL